jgi:trk system potassium uptake protein TrkA
MRVLVIGAGNAGQNLAGKLCAEKHDVILIDREAGRLEEAQSKLDILTIEGGGSSPRTLDKAEVSKADMVVAVTDDDEVNLLACSLAHAAGVPHTVARVSDIDYVTPPEAFDLRRLGADLIVNPKQECAQEIFNILRMPGTLEAVDLFEGRILAVGIKVHMDSPLIRSPLKSFENPELLQRIRFIAVTRGAEMLVPHGDTQFLIGDDVYFAGKPEDVASFLHWAWPEHARFRRVVIAGGGSLGLTLAQLLESSEVDIVLIEKSEERANHCSGVLNRTLVLHGDALEQETIRNAGILDDTAFVAATSSDENNIIGCLLAEKMGARFTLAQVAKPEYVPIIDNLSLLDRAVSPPLSMINAILHFVRGKHVKAAALFHRLPGELLEVALPAGSRPAGQAIKDVKLPRGSLIASVLRGDEVLVATGDLVLREGDRLLLFALPDTVGKISNLFQR